MATPSITTSRSKLYEKVWTTPMRTLAKEFGLSDVGLSKLCRRHDIPVPGLGHWARVRFGKDTKRTPLPPRKDEEEAIVVAATEYRACEPPKDATPKPKLMIEVAEDREIRHPLAIRTRRLFRAATKDQRGILCPKEGTVPHLFVTATALPRALRILDGLLFAIEGQGYILKWPEKEKEKLTINVDSEAIHFAIFESIQQKDHVPTKEELARQKQWSWDRPKWDFVATGKLSISLEELPYGLKTLRKSWSDGKYQRLEDCLGPFIQNLPRAALAIRLDREESERQRQQWAEEAKQRKEANRRQAEYTRKAKLVIRLSNELDQSKQVLQFAAVLRSATNTQDLNDDKRNELSEMAEWSENYASALNPLSRLERALREFKKPPNPYGWDDE